MRNATIYFVDILGLSGESFDVNGVPYYLGPSGITIDDAEVIDEEEWWDLATGGGELIGVTIDEEAGISINTVEMPDGSLVDFVEEIPPLPGDPTGDPESDLESRNSRSGGESSNSWSGNYTCTNMGEVIIDGRKRCSYSRCSLNRPAISGEPPPTYTLIGWASCDGECEPSMDVVISRPFRRIVFGDIEISEGGPAF